MLTDRSTTSQSARKAGIKTFCAQEVEGTWSRFLNFNQGVKPFLFLRYLKTCFSCCISSQQANDILNP